MLLSPVVILVGGPNVGKTKFYTEFTTSAYHYPTEKSTPNITMWITPSFVLVDTPGTIGLRNPQEYSWHGIFRYADVILDFGNWSEDEINGMKTTSPKYMTWSGDNQETIKRVQEYLHRKTM
jgi:hypothetical protein